MSNYPILQGELKDKAKKIRSHRTTMKEEEERNKRMELGVDADMEMSGHATGSGHAIGSSHAIESSHAIGSGQVTGSVQMAGSGQVIGEKAEERVEHLSKSKTKKKSN